MRMVEADPESHLEYTLRDGRLYRLILHTLDFNDTDPNDQWKICVPRAEQERVLRESHEEPTAGHLGIAKTLVRLSRQYYWPGILRTAAKYVRGCLSCKKYKAQQQATAGKMRATNVERPWEIISTDLIGPSPRSTDGHTWLLVTQDRCTKWVELHPLRKATGRAVAEVLRTQICLRYGCPKIIISDNGRQFTNREFQDLLSTLHIKSRTAPSYTPQCNPVERANRIIKTMIAQNTKKNQKIWDKNLTELAFAYNTSQHETTGHTRYSRPPRRSRKIPTKYTHQQAEAVPRTRQYGRKTPTQREREVQTIGKGLPRGERAHTRTRTHSSICH